MVRWKAFPASRFILGGGLLLVGLLSGLFLAALYRPDTSSPPELDSQFLPAKIRISLESELKTGDPLGFEPNIKSDPTMAVPEGDVGNSVDSSGEKSARPVSNHESRKAVEKTTEPVPGLSGEEVVLKTEAPGKAAEETVMIVEVEEPSTVVITGLSVSSEVMEQDLSGIPQKKMVDQDGIERILGKAKFRTYLTTEEDTLWRIAKRMYGSGYYFPVLMECNRSLNIFDMEKGMRVRIFENNQLAERLYNEITCIEGNGVCYYYRVVEGDTFETVARKFSNQEGAAKRIMDLNSRGTLSPGMRIMIPLD